jgi:hypothetical protein
MTTALAAPEPKGQLSHGGPEKGIPMTKALTPRLEEILDSLRGELDALAERMQTSEAKAAGRALFTAYTRRPGAAGRSVGRRPGPFS